MATQEPSISELRSNIEPFIGRTDVNGNPVGNRILLALPENEFNSIHPHLEYAQLQYHQSLHESAEKIEYAYFLNKGMVSLVVVTTDGRSVEVGIVGKEGAVGANLAVGLDKSPYRAVVQIPGDGFRVKSDVLLGILDSAAHLRVMLNRYSQIQGMQVAQLAACNRLHEIEKRLARWMLMCQDRLGSDLLDRQLRNSAAIIDGLRGKRIVERLANPCLNEILAIRRQRHARRQAQMEPVQAMEMLVQKMGVFDSNAAFLDHIAVGAR